MGLPEDPEFGSSCPLFLLFSSFLFKII
jgi:hypothetical protein